MGQPQMNAQELIDTARALVAGDKAVALRDAALCQEADWSP